MGAAHKSATLISRYINGPAILIALTILIPGIEPVYFGLFAGFIAIPVCCLLTIYGTRSGTEYVTNGSIMAILIAIILNIIPGILFSLALIPLGISLGRSVAAQKNEIETAFNGLIILALSLLIYGIIDGIINEVNPYVLLLKQLDALIVQSYQLSKNNPDIALETLVNIDQKLATIRSFIPKLLPGTLACSLLVTVWLNLVVSNSILRKLKPDILTWKRFSEWYLPDNLAWLPIFAGFALIFGSELIATIGLSLLLISILVYFFQGLSILIFFVDRFETPFLFRIAIYAILFQMFGLLLPSLSIVGLADVWFDLRSRYNEKIAQKND